ncbi:hypothetical protein [Methanoculleus sp.]|uniref:hypothetical protein n=1 Tax=Methanoculleus sp. TaxID=90427 RepID=UPI0025D91B5C|nr:hypothetical protein [Methanoculleus sp.]MCK9317902.1 hypothetical protein [Methanoculleus sp.]MDD2253692.1 hypothetical protein [Methanoculleus sp.]MDD2788379.1 hypothetical protein [Methanoculleus sp.]MDD3217051.1 hypothetical protein [Methanoculleus sp.]MDD4314507.1 hypothetical protein [Methanoculleus sp.]
MTNLHQAIMAGWGVQRLTANSKNHRSRSLTIIDLSLSTFIRPPSRDHATLRRSEPFC